MTISVYIPLLLSLVLATLSRPLARWLSPRTAAPALVIAAGLSATASTWGLILLAATLLHEAPPVAERAAAGTHLPSEPVPGLIAAAAGAVLAVGAYRLTEVIKGRRARLVGRQRGW
jgi:predicted PurR-regulated permease PerM